MPKTADQIVMSFASADDATAAVLMLHGRGFNATDVVCYTTAQMRRGALSSLRSRLLTARRELAQQAFSVVVARARNKAMLDRATRVADEAHAYIAQRSGQYRTEDLIIRRPGFTPAAPVAVSGSAPTGRWQTAAPSFRDPPAARLR